MIAPMPAVGVVLAGGASSRMGTDKALLEIGGVAMARLVADALEAAGCDRVWCQGGDAERLAAIGLAVVADESPGAGPLVAIATALSAAAPADVVVAACDMPHITADVVRSIVVAAAQHPDADVVVAADETGSHLLALWRQRAAEPLTALLAAGARSYRGALEALDVVTVDAPSAALHNVNRPGDVPSDR